MRKSLQVQIDDFMLDNDVVLDEEELRTMAKITRRTVVGRMAKFKDLDKYQLTFLRSHITTAVLSNYCSVLVGIKQGQKLRTQNESI